MTIIFYKGVIFLRSMIILVLFEKDCLGLVYSCPDWASKIKSSFSVPGPKLACSIILSLRSVKKIDSLYILIVSKLF